MKKKSQSYFQVSHVACGYGFTVASVKTNDQHKVFGTGINTDSQIGYHAPRAGHPLELLLSPAPIYIPYKSLETKVRFYSLNSLFEGYNFKSHEILFKKLVT